MAPRKWGSSADSLLALCIDEDNRGRDEACLPNLDPPMTRLAGQTVVVIGGSSGIGLERPGTPATKEPT